MSKLDDRFLDHMRKRWSNVDYKIIKREGMVFCCGRRQGEIGSKWTIGEYWASEDAYELAVRAMLLSQQIAEELNGGK